MLFQENGSSNAVIAGYKNQRRTEMRCASQKSVATTVSNNSMTKHSNVI